MNRLILGLLILFSNNVCWSETVQVAVAANFAGPMKQIAEDFERGSGHKVSLSVGATGKFYAQITNAAPFDVFIAADQATPAKLEQQQLTVTGTRFTYAIGKLVLWSSTPHMVDPEGAVLKSGRFAHLSIASPQQAPYGAAAMETLQSLHLADLLQSKIVQGESIGQAYAFVATGNAELGFVALSQVMNQGQIQSGSAWIVPQNLYTPLRQDAVMLKHGNDNPAALALLAYLKSPEARKVIQSYGYE
jgi:molybdate transport system substrate-binding protein